MSKWSLTAAAAFMFLLAGAQTHAQLGKVPPTQLVISAAASDGTYLYIAGVNFGSDPSVFLSGIPLGGVTVNAQGTQITALMPAVPDGTHLLHVSKGNSTTQNGTFDFAVGSTGAPGATGPQGPSGAQGPTGDTGAQGEAGPTGPQGTDGASGEQGLQGATGPQGPEGATGAQGSAGADGATGPQGSAGADGATGPQGSAGADGATGPQGPAGADGATGAQGSAGADGATGTQGSAGADGATGPQGPAGADGATGPQGSAGADGATGPQGPAGADGVTGAQGPQGETGDLGPAGATGATGAQGSAGADGATGAQGATGTQGSQGGIGATGATGAQGPQGTPGTTGPQGSVGATGPTMYTVSVYNAQVNEGDSGGPSGGITPMTFTVMISGALPAGGSVSVDYMTVDGTARVGGDFQGSVGTVTFTSGGSQTQTIEVAVNGDPIRESTEVFSLDLSNLQASAGVAAVISDGTGIGTIVNDDPQPNISIADANLVYEPDGGTYLVSLGVFLSAPSSEIVTVQFGTDEGTATPGSDFQATWGTITFPVGSTTQQIIVQVLGDLEDEGDETFYVRLLSAMNAAIADDSGEVMIVDNDNYD